MARVSALLVNARVCCSYRCREICGIWNGQGRCACSQTTELRDASIVARSAGPVANEWVVVGSVNIVATIAEATCRPPTT